jgi:hypothetical protein
VDVASSASERQAGRMRQPRRASSAEVSAHPDLVVARGGSARRCASGMPRPARPGREPRSSPLGDRGLTIRQCAAARMSGIP